MQLMSIRYAQEVFFLSLALSLSLLSLVFARKKWKDFRGKKMSTRSIGHGALLKGEKKLQMKLTSVGPA